MNFFQALTDEQKKRFEQYTKDCLEESKVEESVLEEVKNGTFPDDPKLKSHALCISKKIHMQNEKGELQTEKLREKLNTQMKNKEEVEKLLQMCILKKETPEDSAYESFQCFHKNLAKDVVIF